MPSLSDPHWYFEVYVERAHEDFLKQPKLPHRAVGAAVAAHHFWERLWKFYDQEGRSDYHRGMSETEFRQHLEDQCPDLNVLRRVVNAMKHQIIKGTITATGVTRVSGDTLIIDFADRGVMEVLNSVMAFWTQWLEDHP